ncbi:MAG: T9SS type A sorting domain-containing protein [Candidatus Marinimicrobia bacterium]|nr:T9SS type A sorting domain-containing protein [Candidatus Neomarinimicrobiota bacterium]
MQKRTLFLVLLVSNLLWSQEFTLHIPSIEHEYMIPVDTSFNQIFIGYYDDDRPDSNIEYLDFTFANNNSTVVEYRLTCFIPVNENAPIATDTLQFEPTSFSTVDSLLVEQIGFNGEELLGIRYVDLPGDSISGFSLQLFNDSSSFQEGFLSFAIASDTTSNWLSFQPLSQGNIWNYSPYAFYTGLRNEIVDTYSNADTSFYRVETQILHHNLSGDSLAVDTSIVYTLDGNLHQIHQGQGFTHGIPVHFCALETFNPGSRDGLLIRTDGSIDYGVWCNGMVYSEQFWRYALGHYWSYAFHAALGVVNVLIGSTIDGVTTGDIGDLVGIDEKPLAVPADFLLSIFPNPFNPMTHIRYSLPENGNIRLVVYDLLGREVIELVNDHRSVGNYETTWYGLDRHGRQMSTGVYFARLEAGRHVDVIKMLFLK